MTVGSNKGKKCFVLSATRYSSLTMDKVLDQAAVNSGIPKGALQAAWTAIGTVLEVWVVEGHSVPVPGLGSMRFGLRAKTVENVEDVKVGLITCRKVHFTPTTKIKQTLKNTSFNITCYDEDGNLIKPEGANA